MNEKPWPYFEIVARAPYADGVLTRGTLSVRQALFFWSLFVVCYSSRRPENKGRRQTRVQTLLSGAETRLIPHWLCSAVTQSLQVLHSCTDLSRRAREARSRSAAANLIKNRHNRRQMKGNVRALPLAVVCFSARRAAIVGYIGDTSRSSFPSERVHFYLFCFSPFCAKHSHSPCATRSSQFPVSPRLAYEKSARRAVKHVCPRTRERGAYCLRRKCAV